MSSPYRRRRPPPPPPSRAYRLHRAAELVTLVEEGAQVGALLRQRLRRPSPGWRAEDVAEVVDLVQNWFRWRGGFAGAMTATALATAARLQDKFGAEPTSFPAETLAGRALPEWAQGYFDEVELRALQERPILWLRARPGTGAEVSAALPGTSRPFAWAPDTLRYEGRVDLFTHPLYQQGRIEIQDLSSQLVVRAAGAQPGETWWDVCAGEGGKTMGLADALANRGTLRATERQAWRVDRLKRRAARLGVFNIRPEVWDGEHAEAPFRSWCDGVLVDAPCSGLGTWRRDPSARWQTDPAVVERLVPLQATLLDRAARRVRPGGRLIYAVCTVTPAETTEQVAAFAARQPEFTPDPLHTLPEAQGASARQIRLSDYGSNGMFIAAWRRA